MKLTQLFILIMLTMLSHSAVSYGYTDDKSEFTAYAFNANAISFEEKEKEKEKDKLVLIQCKHIAWQDVQLLVQPYLSDTLNTALVMQGQSSNYKVSIAAEQLIDEPLPDIIKTILRAIIQADC